MYTLYKRKDGWWYISVIYEGRRVQRSMGTKSAPIARKLLSIRLMDILEELRNPDRELPYPFLSVMNRHLAFVRESRKRGTYVSKEFTLRSFFKSVGNRPISQIKKTDIHGFIANQMHKSRSSRRKYLADLRSFFNWCIENNYLKESPMKGIRVGSSDKRITFMSPAEFKRLLTHTPIYWQPIWELFVLTGLRMGEMWRLRWDDITHDEIKLIGKREKRATIPLCDSVKKVLSQIKKTGEYVVTLPDGTRPNYFYLSKLFKGIVREAGLSEEYSLHTLRHTCATWLLKSGYDVTFVSRYMRHNDISTTMIYVHITGKDIENCGDAISEFYHRTNY